MNIFYYPINMKGENQSGMIVSDSCDENKSKHTKRPVTHVAIIPDSLVRLVHIQIRLPQVRHF